MDANLALAIVEQSPDATIYVDRDGRVLVWNAAAERLFGWTADEMVQSGLDAIIPERFRRAHWDGFQKAIDTGVQKYVDKVLTTRSMDRTGRTLYVDLAFGLVRDAAGRVLGAMATARDCTERYQAERELRARVTTLERSTPPGGLATGSQAG